MLMSPSYVLGCITASPCWVSTETVDKGVTGKIFYSSVWAKLLSNPRHWFIEKMKLIGKYNVKMDFYFLSLFLILEVFVEVKGNLLCLDPQSGFFYSISAQLNSHFPLGNGSLGDMLVQFQKFPATFCY